MAWASVSWATTVVTAVVFSLALTVAVLPPPLLSMMGAASRVRARLSRLPLVMPRLLPCTRVVATAEAFWLLLVVWDTAKLMTSVAPALRLLLAIWASALARLINSVPAPSVTLPRGVLLLITSSPVIELPMLRSEPLIKVDEVPVGSTKLRMSVAAVLPLP